MTSGPHILVDADACPVKEEIYKVALRHKVPVTIVSNSPFRIPEHPLIKRVVADGYSEGERPSASATARRPDRPQPRWTNVHRPAHEGPKYDAADDWISARCGPATIVITADILLAEACLKTGAKVLAHNGKAFTPDSIGSSLATRAIMADLRSGMNAADGIGGPPPFRKSDRSNFLQELDKLLVKMGR